MATTLKEDEKVTFSVVFGHVELATRLRPDGDKIIGEGRAWHYDGKGKLVLDTGWQATGAEITWK
jgi:hypothetical protein